MDIIISYTPGHARIIYTNMRTFLILIICFFFVSCRIPAERERLSLGPKPKTLHLVEEVKIEPIKIEIPKVVFLSRNENELFNVELRQHFGKTNIFITGDRKYWLPSKEWIESFVVFYKGMLEKNKVTYSKQFDCEDFAMLFKVMASKCFVDTITTDCDGIAIGEYWYYPDINVYLQLVSGIVLEGHAINAIILDTGDVIYIEPQTGNIVKLTDSEKSKPYFIKF